MTPDEMVLDAAERFGDELAPGPEVLARARRVVEAHRAHPWATGACSCGQVALRVSHPTHIVQRLAAAGVLAGLRVSPSPSWRSRSFLLGTERRGFAVRDAA